MDIKMTSISKVNAFVGKNLLGNPAGVCFVPELEDRETYQAIAAQNQLPVTAFVCQLEGKFAIRWFTPLTELPLCGHGTIAASYVIFEQQLNKTAEIIFESPIAGELKAMQQENQIVLNFPEKPLKLTAGTDALIAGLAGIEPEEVYDAGDRLLVILQQAEQVKTLEPNIELLKKLPYPGIVITAPGETTDFVSRTFYPHKPNWEDAVTGASHCALVPYWSKKLNKNQLHALQVSPRGGELFCRQGQDRVFIGGRVIWASRCLRIGT